MADDPTVQFSLRPTRECPICGHDMPPEASRCGLCGTTLLRDLLPPEVRNNSLASSAVPPTVENSEPTLVTPLPPPPAPVREEEGAKARLPSPPPRSARVQKEISKAASSSSPSSSRSPRDQKEAATATPPSPPLPNPAPMVPSQEPPPRPTPTQPSALPPIVPVQTTAFGRWRTLAAGALALFTVSFFAAKIFSSSQTEKQEAIQSPEISVERSGEKVTADGKKDVENKEAVAPPRPASPAPQLVARVTTAEQLLPIRIFGADPNDAARGVAVFRAQLEASMQAMRDTYNAQIVENPQALGAAILELNVAPEGQVAGTTVHITGSISRKLQQAIVDVAKVLRFAPIKGGEVKVFYPLFLSPEKVDPAILVSYVKDVWPGRYKVLAATPVPVRAEADESAQEVGTIGSGLLLSVVSSQ